MKKDDTISRQDAINTIMGQPPEAHYPSWYAEQIKALPSAQSTQCNSSNVLRHPQCANRTKLGNCDPVGGFCTSVPKGICDAQVHDVLNDTNIVSRQKAINTVHDMRKKCDTDSIDDYEEMLTMALEELCPVRLETQPEIDEILNYLDTVLHPLVSPEHWDVYATLYDMILLLHFKQPQRTGRWIDGKCNKCGTHAPYWAMASTYYCSEYCPHCGAFMVTEEEM